MVGSIQSEKRLIWHPRHDNKFVVGGGSQITLYEWAPDYPEIRHVTSQHDLQLMKCFAWSPDPFFDDLVAVGMQSGSVDLIRLEGSKYARQNNVLSSGPRASLAVRNQRSCNALAFCTADPNYLAVGLDKVRGDSSLVIWDVHTALPSLTLDTSSNTTANLNSILSRSRPQPQIPRGELGPRTDPRVLQQHAPADTVSALSFLPNSTHLLLAGISNRWFRLFDLRSPVPSSTSAAYKVHGIATDLSDEHRIACFGDGFITVWDTRKLVHPIITFNEKDAHADGAVIRPNSVYQNIEFSTTRRGTLATLERDASYVRLWDITGSQVQKGDESEGSKTSSVAGTQLPKLSWANLPWTASASSQPSQPSPKDTELKPSLVLSDTRRTKNFSRPLASFALVPSPVTHPLTSHVMVVNKEGDLELYAMHDAPKQTVWSARGDLAVGTGLSYKVFSVKVDEEDATREPWDIKQSVRQNSSVKTRSRSAQAREESASRSRGRGRGPHDEEASTHPALFGRGDADGFPALGSVALPSKPTNIMATKPATPARRYSPSDLRNYAPLAAVGGSRSQSRSRHADVPSEMPPRGRTHLPRGTQSLSRQAKGVGHILDEDISMTIRRRALHGYGIGDPHHNANLLQMEQNTDDESDHTLTELWSWISHAKEYISFPTARLHGYDFSYEGLLGIWDGFQPLSGVQSENTPIHRDFLDLPQTDVPYHERHGSRRSRSPADDLHGNFHAALLSLATRRGSDRPSWKPTVSTNKLLQRQVALQLCGWSFKEDEFSTEIRRWEKDGKYSRAACWLVFTRQFTRAIELLMRSEDESHHMMSGTLAALSSHSSVSASRSAELQKHCEHLIVKLQDPYFRAMLTSLTMGDWSDVLSEEVLPFRERLAIAFQFLDDKGLTSYLRSCRGDIDSLIVTGLTKSGMDILQSYIDRTGDIQTGAILVSYVNPWKFRDVRGERWLEGYRDLLDGFKLHHYRVAFDIDYGNILQAAIFSGDIEPFTWVPSQILIRCHYCNKPVTVPGSVVTQKAGKPTSCPNCNRSLPRCSICLMTLGIVQDSVRELELAGSLYKHTLDDAIVICQTCRHGGHASHILDWFFGDQSHGVCAVATCDCQCSNEF